ncbi:diguanylate cyclase domain-containing protein [Paenibacillus lignilyticus]|uniref:PAS domain S-box protein n=1 Tax=Paenibacillus lignilyticus TaxID=1172615 RepID=A0ABS5C776_9BACL|nr:diguanylate cyclase [Paenibacillus lignilyticus]MBP3961497.1 PAS domain S-box protein [Paenibacillus lignilyticus]
MKAFLPNRFNINMLNSRLRMLGVIFVLLVGVFCTAIFSYFEMDHQERDIHNQLEQTIRLQQQYIDKWMSDRMSEMSMIASLPTVTRWERNEIGAILKLSQSKHTDFKALSLIDKDGFSALTESELNVQDRAYFIAARQGEESISDVIVSRMDGKRIIVFAAPVLDATGQFIGLVAGTVDLTTIEGLMKQFTYGKSGQTYLVDSAGMLITGAGAGTGEFDSKPIQSAIVERAKTSSKSKSAYTNYRGETVYGAYTYANNGRWLVIGEAAKADVFASLYTELKYTSLFILLAMAASVFIMFRTARKITDPLNHLLTGVKQIKEGGYHYRIEPEVFRNATLEFRQLCRLYNSMSDTILDQIGALRTERNFVSSIIETAASLVVVIDPDGHIIRFNQSCEQITGYVFEDVDRLSIFEFLVPLEEQPAVRVHFNNLANDNGKTRHENHWRTRSGELRLIAWSNTILKGSQGERDSIISIGIDVTEQRSVEQALIENEERIRLLVGSMDEVVSTFDADLKLTGVYGRAMDSIIHDPHAFYSGKTIHELLNADNAKLHEEAQQKALLERNTVLDWSISSPTGSTYHQTSYSPLRDNGGQVKGVVSVSREVTLLKQTEEAFKVTQTRLNNILESITDAFMALNNDWTFTYVNREAERILGKNREQIMGRLLWDSFPKIVGTAIFSSYHEAMEKQLPVFTEEYLPFMQAWYGVHIYPSKDGLSIYFQNVTQRKELEQAAKDSESRLSTIIETVPNAIVVVDNTGQITMANQMAEDIFGLDKEAILSRTYADEAWVLYDFGENLMPKEDYPVAHVFRTGQVVANSEFVYKRADQSTVIVSCNAAPVMDSRGQITSVLVSLSDITSRIAVESKLQRANDELKKLSSLDGLTGVYNRRYFNEQLRAEWEKHRVDRAPLSLIMLDIDFFKSYNDTYGHQGGDMCLKTVASEIRDSLLMPDSFIARYGGEEFGIVLPSTTKQEAAELAEFVRVRVENNRIPHSKSTVSGYLTISLGAATLIPTIEQDEEMLVAYADKCLYEAKRTRNRVAVYEQLEATFSEG